MVRLFIAALLLSVASVFADGPTDNSAEKVRPVPPPGAPISDADKKELSAGVEQLGKAISELRGTLRDKPALSSLLPDVQIFHNAVRYALQYDEIFNPTNEVPAARQLIKLGLERAEALKAGTAPWNTASGLVVRGYLSKIDGSVQPYGLIVPQGAVSSSPAAWRVDTWFHGRDEKLSELNFLTQRMKSYGDFVPPNSIVIHLYGRYCNANKFAGEVDLFEALDDLKKHYFIDENRIVIRGFSMGGASCWQFATHFPGRWVAAAPGAGFAETADFLKVFQNEKVNPPAYEQKLWNWYDCTTYAGNLFNVPTVAYSGLEDSQIQAANIIAAALEPEGMQLTHITAPKTGHKYTPEAKAEINRRIDAIAALGRNPVPKEVRFTTYTLRYNKSSWVTIEGMDEHWKRARAYATIVNPEIVRIATENINALTIDMPAGYCPLAPADRPKIIVDEVELAGPFITTDKSWLVHLKKQDGTWFVVPSFDDTVLAKRPGLQGPVDDAFMDSFIMVTPTSPAMNEKVGAWVKSEEKHAEDHWRKQFRGEARTLVDQAVTDGDIANNNLILWGDPQSNAVLARIASQLPIVWTPEAVKIGSKTYPAGSHVPVFIYPNPLNPKRYVVINSGVTYREYDYLNNARQVAKLPDFAVVDISKPVTPRAPGQVVQGGFFDEKWQLPKE